MRILDQLVGFADPDRLAPATQPIVENDPGGLTALACARAIAKHETAPEADGVGRIGWRGLHRIEGLIDGPRPGEMGLMGFTGVDHGFELRIGETGKYLARQFRAVGRLWRSNRGHGSGLHQLCRMRLCA